MAFRLGEAGKSVLVIEHGGTDAGPFIQMPAALSYPMNMKRYDWGYKSQPEPHLNNRRLVVPRGKVIGGSSSINGMVYVRGHALDFDHWGEAGADGWRYADVLPYFKRMETWHENGHGGDAGWRGTDGPLHVSRGPRQNPLFRAFVDAGKQAGYETTDDYNGEKQEGFGPMEQTVWNGRRWSAANAYLRPALKRENVSLVKALAQRVVIKDGRATGVEVIRGGKTEVIEAGREVILAASSINSPKILMLSGIGPAGHLREHGIDVVVDRPGVGGNLQDHLEVYMQMAASQPITLYRHWNIFSKAVIGAQWLLFKKGMGASNQFESAAFIRSRPGVKYPDIQYHFCRLQCVMMGRPPPKVTAFRLIPGRCGRNPAGVSASRRAIPQIRPGSCSITCPIRMIGTNSAPASASPAKFSRSLRSNLLSNTKFSRARMCKAMMKSTILSGSTPKAPITLAAPAGWEGPTTATRWSIPRGASSA